MKILIVSDTHRANDNFCRVVEMMKENNEAPDMVFHLGDVEGSEYFLSQVAGCPVEIVAGNNDFFSELPREKVIEVEGKQILLTHGHYYYVSVELEYIRQEARGRDLDIIMFGHTHRPLVDVGEDGVTLLNPGSISYPRQEGKRPSYIVMETDGNGTFTYDIRYLVDEV